MYQDHPLITKPENEHTKIWRYFDFTKFVSLLDKTALFFSRADKLGDPFEGSYPAANIPHELLGQPPVTDNDMRLAGDLSKFAQILPKATFVSSWSMNEHESAALWKIYLKSNEGVAVQSTFARLRDSLHRYPDRLFIGKVRYVDYSRERIPEGNMFFPLLHKRKSFEYEHELRALIVKQLDVPIDAPDIDEHLPSPADYVTCDLGLLIEKVYVSPTSDLWFEKLVRSIGGRYGLRCPIIKSDLVASPVW